MSGFIHIRQIGIFGVRMGLLFLVLPMMVFSCGGIRPYEGYHRAVPTGPGPEDIALDTSLGRPRIIISCSQRRNEDRSQNGYRAYDIGTGVQSRLIIVGLPKEILLSPHGIDVATSTSGTLLYAVNHDRDRDVHGILVFRLGEDSLHFLHELTTPLMFSPNDVCSDHRGGLYVSNDCGKRNSIWEKLWALKRSYVLHFNGSEWKRVGDPLSYANGVGVKGDRLYVTGTQEQTVHRYRITANGIVDRSDIPAIKGNDNITFYNGRLVTTAHSDFMAFIRHVKQDSKPSPCIAYAVDLSTGKLDTLFADDGSTLSAASTGLIVGDSLYLAQVFNPFLLVVPLTGSTFSGR